MVSLELLAVILSSCGNFIIGIFTYRKNPQSTTNKLFFWFTLCVSAYNIVNYFSLHQSDSVSMLFWMRVVMSLALWINILFYLFVKAFPDIHIHDSKLKIGLVIGGTLCLSILSYTNFIFSGIDLSHQPIPGIGIPLFLLHTVIFLGGGIVILIKHWRQAKRVTRTQLALLLLATAFMFVAIIISNVVLVLVFKVSVFVGMLPLYTFVFMATVSYAVIRHRFLDVGFIVARAVTYSFLFLIFSFLFTTSFYLIAAFITGEVVSKTSFITLVLFSAFLIAFYNPLKIFLGKVTSRIFFQDKYDSQVVLANLSKIMSSTFLLNNLVDAVLTEVTSKIKISSASMIFIRNSSIIWVRTVGIKPHLDLNEVEISGIIHKAAAEKESMFIYQEMEESTDKEIMRKYMVSILLPLVVEGEVLGAIFLGDKYTGDIYTAEDITILKIITPQISLAVQNSLSYEEIKRFNITLEREVKLATAQLEEANEKLKELDKLKDDFVSVASHELRTPMTAIKSYLWMALAGKGGAITDKQRYYLDRSYSSTERLIKLVNNMLNISRIESGRMIFEFERLDMKNLVQEVIDEVKPRADELKISLSVKTGENLPRSDVWADSDKLKEVLINLIGNSFKFTPKGGEIEIILEEKDNKLITSVKDNGVGIDAEDQSKLFQKFGMMEGSYVTNQQAIQGTGLGLYICKTIIEKQGGKISAYSEGKGKGSTFSFSLPFYTKEVEKNLASTPKKDQPLGIIHTGV